MLLMLDLKPSARQPEKRQQIGSQYCQLARCGTAIIQRRQEDLAYTVCFMQDLLVNATTFSPFVLHVSATTFSPFVLHVSDQ
mmetsp:Transcript_107646/g.314753  ORF Transcript_107646/g.314753 Transcript_107646/m.314753 type:complete len:82 (+) Transcript_107646:482-727(+)